MLKGKYPIHPTGDPAPSRRNTVDEGPSRRNTIDEDDNPFEGAGRQRSLSQAPLLSIGGRRPSLLYHPSFGSVHTGLQWQGTDEEVSRRLEEGRPEPAPRTSIPTTVRDRRNTELEHWCDALGVANGDREARKQELVDHALAYESFEASLLPEERSELQRFDQDLKQAAAAAAGKVVDTSHAAQFRNTLKAGRLAYGGGFGLITLVTKLASHLGVPGAEKLTLPGGVLVALFGEILAGRKKAQGPHAPPRDLTAYTQWIKLQATILKHKIKGKASFEQATKAEAKINACRREAQQVATGLLMREVGQRMGMKSHPDISRCRSGITADENGDVRLPDGRRVFTYDIGMNKADKGAAWVIWPDGQRTDLNNEVVPRAHEAAFREAEWGLVAAAWRRSGVSDDLSYSAFVPVYALGGALSAWMGENVEDKALYAGLDIPLAALWCALGTLGTLHLQDVGRRGAFSGLPVNPGRDPAKLDLDLNIAQTQVDLLEQRKAAVREAVRELDRDLSAARERVKIKGAGRPQAEARLRQLQAEKHGYARAARRIEKDLAAAILRRDLASSELTSLRTSLKVGYRDLWRDKKYAVAKALAYSFTFLLYALWYIPEVVAPLTGGKKYAAMAFHGAMLVLFFLVRNLVLAPLVYTTLNVGEGVKGLLHHRLRDRNSPALTAWEREPRASQLRSMLGPQPYETVRKVLACVRIDPFDLARHAGDPAATALRSDMIEDAIRTSGVRLQTLHAGLEQALLLRETDLPDLLGGDHQGWLMVRRLLEEILRKASAMSPPAVAAWRALGRPMQAATPDGYRDIEQLLSHIDLPPAAWAVGDSGAADKARAPSDKALRIRHAILHAIAKSGFQNAAALDQAIEAMLAAETTESRHLALMLSAVRREAVTLGVPRSHRAPAAHPALRIWQDDEPQLQQHPQVGKEGHDAIGAVLAAIEPEAWDDLHAHNPSDLFVASEVAFAIRESGADLGTLRRALLGALWHLDRHPGLDGEQRGRLVNALRTMEHEATEAWQLKTSPEASLLGDFAPDLLAAGADPDAYQLVEKVFAAIPPVPMDEAQEWDRDRIGPAIENSGVDVHLLTPAVSNVSAALDSAAAKYEYSGDRRLLSQATANLLRELLLACQLRAAATPGAQQP